MTSVARCVRGTSVVEVLVSLLLALVLMVLSMTILARQRSVQAALSARMETLGSVRTARHVAGSDIRESWTGGGVTLYAPDSVQVRAMRGVVRVCAILDPHRLLAAVEGVRLPDPSKDSLVLLTVGGTTQAVALVSADAGIGGDCGDRPGRPFVLALSDTVASGAILGGYFERGSYHLTGGALRYRRGLAGRQPLTPQVLRTPSSGFVATAGGPGIVLEAVSGGETWWVSLRTRGR